MKLINKSSKVINVGLNAIMPDGSIPVNETIAKLPSIQALIKRGLLEVDDSAEKLEAAKREAAEQARREAEEEAKKKAEAEAEAKKAEEAAAKKAAAEAKKKAEEAKKAAASEQSE